MTSIFTDLNTGNQGHTQVEPLITVEKLKKTYLFGVTAFADNGEQLDDTALQTFINNAVSILEHDLDLAITPRTIDEHKDYFANDYWDWGFLQLNRIPVINVNSIKIVYLRDQNGLQTVLDIPEPWIRLDPPTGLIRLIPNNKFPANLQVDGAGAFFPELFRRYSMVPNLWVVNYTWGFKDGCVPSLMNAAIGMIASIFAMNIAGDLILGAGIAGTSIGLDGLSQAIQSTASAENHAYSAKVKEYGFQLYGRTSNDPNGIIPILRRYYKGQNLNII